MHVPGLQKDRDRRTAGPMEGLSSIGRFSKTSKIWNKFSIFFGGKGQMLSK